MTGRDYIPGESEPFLGLRDHARYLSRIIRGQIADVTPEEGRVQVSGIIPANSHSITIKPLWFSATPTNPTPKDKAAGDFSPTDPTPKTAWGRYMPIGREMVDIAYYNDDRPMIIGYDITATEEETQAGYKNLVTARDNKVPAYASFRDLKKGEFDFKSVGDAYIFGSDAGVLLLAGKQAFIRLNGPSYRLDFKAAESNFTSNTCKLRFGTIFRKDIGSTVETAVGIGSLKEFLIDINATEPTTGTAISPSRIKVHLGDVINETTLTQEQSESFNNLRARIAVGSDTLLEVFKLEIDDKGNVVWDQNAVATDGFKMRANPILLNSTGASGGTGGIIKITQTNISLGAEDGINRAVLWDPGLKKELNDIKTDLSNLANDVKTHRHPLSAFPIGIPIGKFAQTIQVKFQNLPDGSVKITDAGPATGDLATQECAPNSGPMNLAKDVGETNMVDTVIPRSLGGFFQSEYSVGNPSSSIVKVER